PFPDGSTPHFLTRKFPIFDDAGNLLAIGIISTDISARRRMEEELRDTAEQLWLSEERYRSFFAYAGEGIFISDAQSTIVNANLAAARILDYDDPAALVGINAADLVHPDDLAQQPLQTVLEHLPPDEVARLERRYRRRDGTWIPVAVAINFIADTGYHHVFFTDLTVRRRLEAEKARAEEQYRQSQKVESIGRLAGGMAHDLNNLLTPVIGYSELLLEELGNRDRYRGPLEHIVSAAERARDLVQQLLAFSRKQTLEYRIFDLNRVIRRFAGLLRRIIREDVTFSMQLDSGPLTVQADIRQLEQVIMNLAVNARDAMPDGGRLTLETGLETLAADALRQRHPDLAPGVYVRLTVSDTGRGMDAETVNKIFEPFFSTKGELGTGLGLATAYGIVKQHGGDIRVESTPGAGTVFRVYLPRAAAGTPEAAAVVPPAAEPGAAAGTVLLVE
ncbi:MAG: PAS domain S-box protein, partial [Deltaproteobacteria bacterium]|nr:PAS domain S-box protein [Candidatus Anaeroferrophillacea bacterium]